MHVADLDGDGRDDLLIAGTDRFGVLQTGRKGQRLKTIATYESKRNEARLGRPGHGRRQRRRLPRRRLHRRRRTIARNRHLRRRPRAVSGDHLQDLRAQELSQRRRRRSNRATWPSATWTATAGPISSWSSTTASWSCARIPAKPAKPAKPATKRRRRKASATRRLVAHAREHAGRRSSRLRSADDRDDAFATISG